MKRFDNKGAIVIPNPIKAKSIDKEKALVFTYLYCPNGHSLVSSRAKFNSYNGILLKVKQNGQAGIMALSPVYGDKSKITLDIDLEPGKEARLFCPECDVELPVHSECHCGGKMIVLFRTKEASFSECVAVCNRVDCESANIVHGGKLVSVKMLEII